MKKKGYTAAYVVNAKSMNEWVEKSLANGKNFDSMWLDFETWLMQNHSSNVSDLSWNAYVERSKEYNTERLKGEKEWLKLHYI